jgi:epoxyqueuosine reductase QueG
MSRKQDARSGRSRNAGGFKSGDGRDVMEINVSTIKEMIRDEGIDLVGIAYANALLLASPPRPAADLMPEARSVVVMAVAHSLGAVYAPDIRMWTRNKMQTSRLLDQTAEKVGRLLEREGYLSLPVSADKPVEIHKLDPETGKKLPHVRTVGHISLKHAAVSAGMGCMGRSNLLLTPEFGPHQRLGAIISEVPLEPDPPRSYELCPPGCRLCEDACPVKALRDGDYDVDPCFDYWSMGFEHVRPRRLSEWPAYAGMLRRHLRRRDMLVETGQIYITDVDFCIECMKACPVGERWKGMRPGTSPA